MRVLVAVASKHGATREIAEAIARSLADAGLVVEVENVEDVSDVASYDAVVLGSAVYMGSWLEPARRFAENHAEALTARPAWLFSSGPTGDPPRPSPDKAVSIDSIADRIHPKDHRLFAGKLDHRQLSFAEHALVLAVRAAEGDFRDWGEIATWAAEIAAALQR
jgi:menaquinone-dependent protoporphyrinogen oxidase